MSMSMQKNRRRYLNIRVELGKMWNSECVVVPIVVGGLGAVSHNFTKYLGMVPAQLCATMCIKITLLGSKKLMRSFLSRK